MQIEYRSVADLNQTILVNLHKLPKDIDLVVGIPRSGLLAATMLALHLNLPLTDVDGLIEGRFMHGGARCEGERLKPNLSRGLNALVLDDSISSGQQIRKTKAQIDAAGLSHEILYGAVYATPKATGFVDVHFETVRKPRIFEWNLMHSAMLRRSCVDIDGVLCRDPSERENDDGPIYQGFLEGVESLLIPTLPVGWLVTCRLEKYRALTERWLARHGIVYKELIMMDLPSKAARLAAGTHARYKAEVYAKTGAVLFIESSMKQAREIANLTGKQVFCMETREMISGSMKARAQRSIHSCPLRWYRNARKAGIKVYRCIRGK